MVIFPLSSTRLYCRWRHYFIISLKQHVPTSIERLSRTHEHAPIYLKVFSCCFHERSESSTYCEGGMRFTRIMGGKFVAYKRFG